METSELLKKVRKIEIKTKGLSKQLFSGEYHSTFKGRGMSFSEVRNYFPGDDVRNIDWNVTARTNEPYIKVFEEERELTVMLLVDVSRSSFFGTTNRMKNEFVTEVSAVLAFSAIENNDKSGIYGEESLTLIQELTDSIQMIDGVDPERVVSIATENNIYGDADGMIIEPFLEDVTQGALIRQSIEDFPLYLGNLVSPDGTVSLIIVELLDKQKYGADVYAHLQAMVAAHNGPETIYVAGEGAVVEHLGKYVQDDAKLMTPLAFLVITVVLFMAYRTWGGLLLSNMVVMGSLLIAMGIMVGLGVPFYLISNIIPVIIIAISVADSIHIMGHFYELKANHPERSTKELTIETMVEMWRPILVTSVTNIVGFIAMGYSSDMPPMRAVGLYSSVGVVVALLLSLFLLLISS